MENLRDLLRSSLASALDGLTPEDRISTCWPVVCGPAIAQRTRILSFTENTLQIAVFDAIWLQQMKDLHAKFLHDLPRISKVPVNAILYSVRPELFTAQEDKTHE
jgi:hypothetical protein